MKALRRLVAVAAITALAIGLAPPAFADPDDPVSIPDEGLQACIANGLQVEPAASYTQAQLVSLERLDCSSDDFSTEVNNLTGLEHATNLATFSVYGNLTDISPLAALPLTDLTIASYSDQPFDMSPLAGKTSLVSLHYYADNPEPLPGFPNLEELDLNGVPLSVISTSALPSLTKLAQYGGASPADLSALSNLPELTTLNLRGNDLTSIPSSLSLPKLEEADFSANEISDISALPSMPALERLDLSWNQLTELPTLNLPKLDWLGLAHNRISSISANSNLPELNAISLVANQLTNIGPLKSYPSLSVVFVKKNHITDLSNLGASYPFKGQLHARTQYLTDRSARACTLVPLPAVKGASDSRHPIVWELPAGAVRSGSNVILPDTSGEDGYRMAFSQLGRFTRSDSKDDIYFSGSYYQEVTRATAIYAPTPTVSGTARYGSKVSVGGGSWCPAATARKFQWLRNGAAIAKATGSTYTLTTSDIGKKISVRVTGTRTGLSTVVKTSAQVVVGKGTLGAKTPAITGTAKKGKKLKVKMSAWTPAKVKISYQWLRNGKAIKKATKSSYKLTKSDKKKYISVRVTGSKTGYATVSKTSAKTKKVK